MAKPYRLITTGDDAKGGAARCPRCSYSLVGLPSEHSCPECGLQYDEKTLVWRITGLRAFIYSMTPRQYLVFGLLCVLALLPAIPSAAVFLKLPSRPLLKLLITVLLFAVAFYWVRRRMRHGVVVALLPEGMYLANAGDASGGSLPRSRIINWSTVQEIVWHESQKLVEVCCTGGTGAISIVFGDTEAGLAFVREASVRLQEYDTAERTEG